MTEFGTDVALRAFDRPRANARRVFDDRSLAAKRHPGEVPALILALSAVVVVVAAVSIFAWAAGLGIICLLCLAAVITRLKTAQQLAQAAEITPTQFAHLYPVVAELRQRFTMPRTRVFVTQSPVINAVSSGLQEPFVIVLNSALLDALDAQELKSVLGHEMGHIKFGHTRLGVLLGGVDARGLSLPFPISLIAGLRDFIFLWWQRSTEMSADRAGIIACGRPSKAISAQVKLSVGPTLYQHVTFEDLALQAADLDTGVARVEGFLSQLGTSHPFLINRIRAMLDFVSQAPLAAAEDVVAAAPTARLLVRSATNGSAEHGSAGQVDAAAQADWQPAFVLNARPVVAGRSPSAEVRLPDRTVSRRHFEVGWQDGGYVIRDLGSNNGTFVNAQRIATATLHDGDVVRAGRIELVFKEGPAD